MQLRTLLLLGSLGANAALLVAFSFRPDFAPPALRDYFRSSQTIAARTKDEHARAERAAETARKKQTSAAAAAQAQLWNDLQPDDLAGLVARLRAAGFPPAVIRAVVNAQLQSRFSARMNALAATAENIPYWKPTPIGSSFNNPKFFEERSQIYRERAKLLRELLGDDFFASAGGDPTAAQRRQFGDLPKAKIDLVQRVEDDYAELASQVKAAMGGITLPEDREKLALLDQEKHADLAALLTPQELEDYEMRSSPIMGRLRTALTLMDATEAEFRTIFRIQQQYNDRINPTGGISGAAASQARRDATNEMNGRLKTAIGDARATEFARASNYEFQGLAQLAQRENLPVAAAVRAYDLRDSTSKESLRIYEDKTLTYDQQLAALQTLAQSTRAQLIATLGPKAGASYGQSANWLKAIEGGGVVTFDGTMTMYRTIQRPTPPPAPTK